MQNNLDNDTPLYVPDEPLDHYGAADKNNVDEAHYASYSAVVATSPKIGGNQ